MVERVHKLYEELGRKDVQAVEEMEKAKRGDRPIPMPGVKTKLTLRTKMSDHIKAGVYC